MGLEQIVVDIRSGLCYPRPMLTLMQNSENGDGAVSRSIHGSEAGYVPMPTSSALMKMHASKVSGYSLVLASNAKGNTEEGITKIVFGIA
jgi:hypothetical protein